MLAACVAAAGAQAQGAQAQGDGPALKRFWIDKDAGLSVALPVDHPTLGFKQMSSQSDPSALVLARPVFLSQSSASAGTERGSAICVARRSYPDQGQTLTAILGQAEAAPDGGKALGKERCESNIYQAGATQKTFYGVRLDKTALGLSETCVAASNTGNGDFPYIVTQRTIFAKGDHGYDLSCSITVRNEADARYMWGDNARAFSTIRESIALAPAD